MDTTQNTGRRSCDPAGSVPTGPERAASFVAVPKELFAMVAERLLSPSGLCLYAAMIKMLPRDGGIEITASRSELAKAMGLQKTSSVDRYVAELESKALMSVERRKVETGGKMINDRSVYRLRLLWRGSEKGTTPLSSDQGGGPEKGTTPPPAETQETAGQGVVPKRGLGGSPEKGTVELEGFDLEEVQLPQDASVTAVTDRPAGEEEENPAPKNEEQNPAQAALADLNLTAAEARSVVAEVERLYGPARFSLGAYLAKLHADGKVAPIVAALRAPDRDRTLTQWRRSLLGRARCAHEVEGGAERNPLTGRLACPHCHRLSAAA